MSDPSEDTTLTLKEAAALLRVSYSTVYAHREELGFFQVGSIWRIWRSQLMSMGGRSVDPPIDTAGEKKTKNKTKPVDIGSWIDGMTPRKIEEELDRLVISSRNSRNSAHRDN